MNRQMWSRGAGRLTQDDGFSLVEAIVSLLVATLMFGALAATAMASVRASLISRQNQQATDFMTRELEGARKVSFAALGHVAADLVPAADVRIQTSGCVSAKCFNPGTGQTEDLLTIASGAAIPAHKRVLASAADGNNNTTFNLWRYVTVPTGQDPAQVRRVTVVATWATYGQTHTRTTSTLVALAQIGLPLPNFKLTPVGSLSSTVNPGARLIFGARLSNQGATDRWNLALTSALGWTMVRDNGDGFYDATLDTTAIVDTNLDAKPDTGAILPAGDFVLWLWRQTASTDATGTFPLTLTATSVGQPTALTAAQSVAYSAVIVTGAVPPAPPPVVPPAPPGPADCATTPPPALPGEPSYTQVTWSLHNSLPSGDTISQSQMTMNGTGPYASSLNDYSTETDTLAGRVLRPSALGLSETNPVKYADWRNQVVLAGNGKGGDFKGLSRLRLWVGAAPSSTVNLTLLIYSRTAGSTSTPIRTDSRSFTNWPCTGFQEIYFDTASLGTPAVPNNGFLGFRLVNTGSADVRLAYDVNGAYPAAFVVNNK